VAKKTAKKPAKRPGKKAAKKTVKRTVKRAVKRPAKRPVKRQAKRPIKRPVKRIARKSAKRAKGTPSKGTKRMYHRGDAVMHWTYGLGSVVRLENRELLGQKMLYYAVQVGDMTVWVPNDDQLLIRLRRPSTRGQLPKLRALLSKPGVTLPQDRHERKTLLLEMLKDGRAESLCKVIRSLVVFAKNHPLNDNDQALLKRAQTALLAEWSHALSVTPAQVEQQLQRHIGIPPSTAAREPTQE
jgi:RNA polymerase-interacting CarD/CdnL/TRCF family regulator